MQGEEVHRYEELFDEGLVFNNQGDYVNALYRFEESLALQRPLLDPADVSYLTNTLYNIARLYERTNNITRALEFYMEIYNMNITNNDIDDPNLAQTCHNIGKTHYYQSIRLRNENNEPSMRNELIRNELADALKYLEQAKTRFNTFFQEEYNLYITNNTLIANSKYASF